MLHPPPISAPRILDGKCYVLKVIVEQPDRFLEEAAIVELVCLLTDTNIRSVERVRTVYRFARVPQESRHIHTASCRENVTY